MEELVSIEEYIASYTSIVYSAFPNLINYVGLNNNYGAYIGQLENLVNDNMPEAFEYETYIDFASWMDICLDILESMGSNYRDEFIKCINDGTFSFDEDGDDYSYTTVQNNHRSCYIEKNNTIEDVFEAIHEFFHSEHLKKFDNDMQNEKWYTLTEGIAMAAEFYAIMYLYKKGSMRKDIVMYLKKMFANLFVKANNSLFEGFLIGVYDSFGSFDKVDTMTYIKQRNFPEEFVNMIDYVNLDEDFMYHINSTYVLGFPSAFMIAKKMIDDPYYIGLFNKQFKDIRHYDVESILQTFGLRDILDDVDFIFDVMEYINGISELVFKEDRIDLKQYVVEMR